MKKLRERVVVTLALAMCIAFVLPGLCASAENIGTYPVGEEMGWITFYESRLPIINCVLNSGNLPANVEMYWDENGVYLTGVPETMGSFVAEYYVFTDEGVSPAYVSFTVGAEATPVPNQNIVITKSPTGEHVEVGGTAKFVARAQNAERIVWRIVSNDTTNTVKAADGPQYFPGLQVSTDAVLRGEQGRKVILPVQDIHGGTEGTGQPGGAGHQTETPGGEQGMNRFRAVNSG